MDTLYTVYCYCSVAQSVQLFTILWTGARQASLSFTVSQSLLKLMSIESMMSSSHLILCRPLLLLPSTFPSIRVFSKVSAHRIKWPEYWSFSFSISPSNEHSGLISFGIDWFDLLAAKGLWNVFCCTTVKTINSLVLSLVYGSPLTSIYNYWKNHGFDYIDLCWQSDISAF